VGPLEKAPLSIHSDGRIATEKGWISKYLCTPGLHAFIPDAINTAIRDGSHGCTRQFSGIMNGMVLFTLTQLYDFYTKIKLQL
jgi:hypothetical protein